MASTVENKIFVAVREILKASSIYKTAGGYIQNVFDGVRNDVPEGGFPCIILEPGSTTEEPGTVGRKRLLKFNLRIACFMEGVDFDNQIVGTTSPSLKGILDIVNDVKNALEVYSDLNYDATVKRCNFFTFPDVKFEAELFPFRVAEITLQATVLTDGASLR
jgi:hypothetical protein